MSKIRIIEHEGGLTEWQIRCPGCGCIHAATSATHTFNGDLIRPTFSPGWTQYFFPGHFEPGYTPGDLCQFFIENGYVRFTFDSDHPLKGQTVDMFPI